MTPQQISQEKLNELELDVTFIEMALFAKRAAFESALLEARFEPDSRNWGMVQDAARHVAETTYDLQQARDKVERYRRMM